MRRYSDTSINAFHVFDNQKAYKNENARDGFSDTFKRMVRQVANETNISNALKWANHVLAGHGVEYMRDERDDINYRDMYGIEYVNMGDSYVETVIYDHSARRFRFMSLGDLIESMPRRFKE